MNISRISACALALTAAGVLAACGGGGGGGVTPSPGGGGGGGGGGGTTPTPTPTGSPTGKPSVTPSPTPTATPTPTPTVSPGGVAVSTYTIQAQTGPQVNPPGGQGWYTAGVTVSWTPNPGQLGQNGDTSAGANATNNFPTLDGMSCSPTVEPAVSPNTYSVHAFVGIYNNGTEEALPQAIGMKNPIAPSSPVPGSTATPHPNDNYEVESQDCEYNIHTHDYSGLVHIEDVGFGQSNSTTSPLPYNPTLKSLLDIWGVQLSAAGVTVPGQTGLIGPTTVYYGNQSLTDKGPNGGFVTDAYQKATAADGSTVPLAFHTTVWIVVGSIPHQPTGDTGLPKVEWRITH